MLGDFAAAFTTAYQAGLRRKLGLFTARDGDDALVQDLLDAMAKNQADFTLTFRRLSDAAARCRRRYRVRRLFADPAAFDAWAARWRQRLARRAAGPPPSGRPRCGRSIRPSSRATTGSKR